MKGLLKKDLYMAWAYSRMFLFILAFFFVLSFFVKDSLFFLAYPMIIVSMLPVNLLSYDERFKWSVYCDALPLTRAQVVSEKYLFSLLCGGAVLLLLGGVRGGILLLQGQSAAFFDLLSFLILFGLVGPALILPFIFSWGPEKGRLVYLVFIGAICAATVLLMNRPLAQTERFGSRPIDALLALIVGALVFAASWVLSIKLYQKRAL